MARCNNCFPGNQRVKVGIPVIQWVMNFMRITKEASSAVPPPSGHPGSLVMRCVVGPQRLENPKGTGDPQIFKYSSPSREPLGIIVKVFSLTQLEIQPATSQSHGRHSTTRTPRCNSNKSLQGYTTEFEF